MRSIWLVLFLVTTLTISACSATADSQPPAQKSASPTQTAGMSMERLQRLSHAFQRYVDERKIPGAVIYVSRKGQTVYQQSFGKLDIEAGTAMPSDAIFRIASQTKAIVSVATMMLQEEGKLLIQDPVGKYLPEYLETTVAVPNENGSYDIVPAKRLITIRDLLTHTAGIDYGDGPAAELWQQAGIQGWYFADRDEPIRETVRRMADLPFAAQPGEAFVYGYSIDILGALLEVVTGLPLDQLLAEKILQPLSMNDTHFYLPPEKANRFAKVYSATETGIEPAPNPGGMVGQGLYTNGPRKSFSGGAGLLSTASDYARFLQMMLNGGTLDGMRFLSRKSVEMMTVNHLGELEYPWDGGMGFGLGFSVVLDLGQYAKLSSPGQYGWGGAYHSTYWVDPSEELVVVYFTQLIPAMELDDQEKLRALVYQAIID